MLAYGSEEYQTLRALDAKGTERLLQLGRISPLHTFMGRGSDGFCESLLYYATECEWHNGIALFVWYGGDPSAPEPYRNKTALECVYDSRNLVDERYALALFGQWPVDKPILEASGVTALMHAAERNHVYAIRLLLWRLGADPDVRDTNDRNAIYYAMRRVDERLRRNYARFSGIRDKEDEPLDPALEELIGPLDPVEYKHLSLAMHHIRVNASRRWHCRLEA